MSKVVVRDYKNKALLSEEIKEKIVVSEKIAEELSKKRIKL